MNFLKTTFYALAMVSLVACGGSGGGGGSSVDPGTGSGGGTTPTNNSPAFTTGGSVSVGEGATAVVTLEASDDEGDTLTFAFGGGADDALFTLDESTGALAFTAAPDFEAPGSAAGTNVYTVIVTVSDGTNDAVSLTIEITVTDVASPAFTTTAAQSLVEGGTSVATISAAGAVTMTAGADLSKFTLSNMNALTFNAAPDFENPLDADSKNTYEVTFTATEGSETSTLAMTVTIKDAYEGRVIDGPVSGSNVFIDLDGDSVQDASEPNTTSDSNGYYFVEKADAATGVTPKLVAIGGTDTSTGTELPDLALVADVPASETSSAYITPISTIIAAAANETEKTQVLAALGITDLTPEQLLTKDVWSEAQSADSATAAIAQAVQKANLQVAAILQAATELVDTSASATKATRIVGMVNAVASGLLTQAKAGVSLTTGDAIQAAMTAAITTYAANIDTTVVVANYTSAIAAVTENVVSVVDQIKLLTDVTAAAAVTYVKEFQTDILASISSTVVTVVAAVASGDTAAANTAIASLATAVTASLDEAQTAVAAAETAAVTTGYTLPKTITVIETVE